MHNHVLPASRILPVHNNPDVRDISSQIPSDEVSGRIVINLMANRQRLAFAHEEGHQIWDSAVINI
jgi:hypothetical protein